MSDLSRESNPLDHKQSSSPHQGPRPAEPDHTTDLSLHSLTGQHSARPASTAKQSEVSEEADEGILERTARAFGTNAKEAQQLGAVDRADRGVELTFQEGRRTEDSPASKALWGKASYDLFASQATRFTPEQEVFMQNCLDTVRGHKRAGTLLDENGKISEKAMSDLAAVGYWGALVPKEYGGIDLPFTAFQEFLKQVAKVDPTVAGLASVHGCIGAVDPLVTFGNEAQKQKYLPLLASGEALSAFALTERGAGSDLTAVQTQAVLDGDDYVVNGGKYFITNAALGRKIGLVVKIDGKHAVLIADLPDQENENFSIERYGLRALKHAHNVGLNFKDFRVPKENLLYVQEADGSLRPDKGLVIAYHGLNRGRISLCANAAGTMEAMMADTIPWARYRETYAKEIGERELVRKRFGEWAGYIAGAEAISQWAANLLDEGFRGEAECIIAKVFGSEVQKHVTLEYAMKTHGGRFFKKGHPIGDNVDDLLAPCIYEGEGEMLLMALFNVMTKVHTSKALMPLINKASALVASGKVDKFPETPGEILRNPGAAWQAKGEVANLAIESAKIRLRNFGRNMLGLVGLRHDVPDEVPKELRRHIEFAMKGLEDLAVKANAAMLKYSKKMPDRQCTMAELAKEGMNLMVMAVTAAWGEHQDGARREAANVLAHKLKMEITGKKPDADYFKRSSMLGKRILSGETSFGSGIEASEILAPYK